MPVPADLRALVGVDLGAESCRVSLLRWLEGKPLLTLVHRFANGPVHREGSMFWDLAAIEDGVAYGLRRAAELAPEGIRSLAVDGWAVDYVRLGADGLALSDPFCYRDERTLASETVLHAELSPDRMAAITAMRPMRINTLYQLAADRAAGLEPGPWLNLPEYLLHRLGGRRVAERTNASHTQMVDATTGKWSAEIADAAGLDFTLHAEIVPTGTILGTVCGELATLPAYADTKLIAPACHDTASAVAGIPAEGDDWAYISSGTWSLVGAVVEQPIRSKLASEDGFTNFAGAGGSFCFHANVNGMWMLAQCMQFWSAAGHAWTIEDLVEGARSCPTPPHLLDVDDPALLLAGEMPARLNTQLAARGCKTLKAEDAIGFASLIFHSLAERYAQVLARVQVHTGKPLRRVYLVGGGSRNQFLNQLIAERTELEVMRGSAESSTIGNFAVQLAALESLDGATRTAIARRALRLSAGDVSGPALQRV